MTFVSAVQKGCILDDHVQCRFFLNIDIDVIRYQNIIKSILRTSTCYTKSYEVNIELIILFYNRKDHSNGNKPTSYDMYVTC